MKVDKGQTFEVTLSSEEVLKGCYWPAEHPVANLNIAPGMCEMSWRYGDFARFLNTKGISVWALDSPGQGLNVDAVEDLEKWPVGGFEKNVEGIHLMNILAGQNGLPTTVLGHSMGSFMVQSLIQRYPAYTEKVILMGSNGGQGFLMKLGYMVAKMVVKKKNWDLPSALLYSLSLGGYEKAIKERKTPTDWLSYDEENVKQYLYDPYSGRPPTGGFWHEFLKGMSTLWNGKNLKKMSKDEDILIVSGDEDPVGRNGKGPKWLYKKYQKLGIKNVQIKIYEHMRHEILNEGERKQIVYDDLANFVLLGRLENEQQINF